jgi:hypothetical protein
MIDGAALKTTPGESSFAEMVSAAGISSIEFTPQATHSEFDSFVRAFAASGPKFEGLSKLLKDALGEPGASGIRVNEFRVVASDAVGESGQAQARAVGEAMAKALGSEAGELKEALADPQKLLALIAAAEGAAESQGGQGGPGGGGPGGAADGSAQGAASAGTPIAQGGVLATGAPTTATPAAAPTSRATPPAAAASSGEIDELTVFRMLGQLGQGSGKPGAPIDPEHFRQQVAAMPAQSRHVLQQALAAIANESPGAQDPQLLLKLAERLAIRIAMKRFERGDTKVDAVQEMLNRMGSEIDSLRKKLASYEEKPQVAEVQEEREEGLEQKFWTILPAEDKLRMLLGPAAFEVSVRHIRQFLEHVPRRGDLQTPRTVLAHYAEGIREKDAQMRQRVAEGIAALSDHYASAGDDTLAAAIAAIGAQLLAEKKTDLQNSLCTTLVHLSQQAADCRHYTALKQAMMQLSLLSHERPDLANTLRPRIGLENRVPHLIEEALKKPSVPQSLLDVLKEMPRTAALQAAHQFNLATETERSDRVIALAQALGPDTAEVLRETLRSSPDSEALLTIGLLTRLESGAVAEHLSARLPRWNHFYQNQVVRQLASSGAAGRGELLAHLLDQFDPLVLAPAVDEIGMSGDIQGAPRLMRLASGELPSGWPSYLQVKAIEALRRLHAKEAVPILRKIVEEKKLWMWAQPRELRVVALQALLKIEPEWARKFAPDSGLAQDEIALAPREATADWTGVRQRCYERIRPQRAVKAEIVVGKQKFELSVVDLSLGGAFAMGEIHLPAGTCAELTLKAGTAEATATVLLRGARKGGVNFEIVDISFEERSKLRRMLIDLQKESS